MKSIILLLCIALFIFSPSILLAKQICIAPGGCKIEMDTGSFSSFSQYQMICF